MKVQKTISLDEETAALAAECSNLSEFVRHALKNRDLTAAIERLEELQAILDARMASKKAFEAHLVRAWDNKSWSEVKKALIGRGLI